MFNRKEKMAKRLLVICMLMFGLTLMANGQKVACKKWTYDFSDVVKYSETPLDACKNYVKEKYPNDNYKASVEATNDAETFRCSASDTYIGVVYKRACETCCKKPAQAAKTSAWQIIE
jgi:hypothetical protein